jgi:transposase
MNPFRLTARQCSQLRQLAASTDQARILRRAQALLWLAHGDSPAAVVERLDVSRQTLYNWAYRFQDRTDLDLLKRLADGPRPGRPRTAHGIIDPLLDQVIEDDPRPWGYRATVWTAPLLRRYLQERHGVVVSCQSVRLALDRLGVRWKRPRHRLALRPATWRQAKGGSNGGSASGCGRSC